jgi:hypothetical protein
MVMGLWTVFSGFFRGRLDSISNSGALMAPSYAPHDAPLVEEKKMTLLSPWITHWDVRVKILCEIAYPV